MPKRNPNNRNGKRRFSSIPHFVLDSPDFRNLSGRAVKALLILVRQFNGHNNGDLSAPFKYAREWGFSSKTTLAKALKELRERNLIIVTREGKFLTPGGVCTLYALTWEPINECKGKISVNPTDKPLRNFAMEFQNSLSRNWTQ